MKIAILTFHSGYNFGANLQALSVQEILKHGGHRPVIVAYRDPATVEKARSKVPSAQAEVHEKFIEKYLDTSPRFSCIRDVREYCDDGFDMLLVGSDQVFRLLSRWAPKSLLRRLLTGNASSAWTHVTDRLPVYYLPWPRRGQGGPSRVSIAACATGTSYFFLGKTLRTEALQSLCNFDFVSVRDDWTRLVVRWLSRGKVKPVLCPDPVFGLNECFSVPREERSGIDVSRAILLSGHWDHGWLMEFRRLAHDQGFKIGNLPDPERTFALDGSDFSIDLPLSPLAWYALLSGAAGYIGSRYHGLVTCVANRTPVVSLEVSKRPRGLKMTSRTYDLCRKAGARSRYRPVNWLSHPSPGSVLRTLMDDSSQAAMNSYAEQAKARLRQVIREATACADAVSASRSGRQASHV